MKQTKEQFPSEQIPKGYQACFLAGCPKAEMCMRHLVGLHLPADRQWGPAVYPGALAQGGCTMFKATRVMHGAWGFRTLFRNVKRHDDTPLRNKLKDSLGSHGTYYRYNSGKRLLTPEQQERVIAIFRSYGYADNLVFDGYRDEYDFT